MLAKTLSKVGNSSSSTGWNWKRPFKSWERSGKKKGNEVYAGNHDQAHSAAKEPFQALLPVSPFRLL